MNRWWSISAAVFCTFRARVICSRRPENICKFSSIIFAISPRPTHGGGAKLSEMNRGKLGPILPRLRQEMPPNDDDWTRRKFPQFRPLFAAIESDIDFDIIPWRSKWKELTARSQSGDSGNCFDSARFIMVFPIYSLVFVSPAPVPIATSSKNSISFRKWKLHPPRRVSIKVESRENGNSKNRKYLGGNNKSASGETQILGVWKDGVRWRPSGGRRCGRWLKSRPDSLLAEAPTGWQGGVGQARDPGSHEARMRGRQLNLLDSSKTIPIIICLFILISHLQVSKSF